jgi:hypothetical protein
MRYTKLPLRLERISARPNETEISHGRVSWQSS